MWKRWISTSLCMSLVGGCAGLPEVRVGHYLPQGAMTATVVRTVGCATRKDAAGVDEKRLFAAATASTKMSYSRDPSGFRTVDIKQFGSKGKSAILGFTYYDDGRLKGMNSTSTGSGQEIVEAAAKLVGIVVGIAGVGLSGDDTPACALIAEQAKKDEPITLTYVLSDAFAAADYPAGKVRTLVLSPSPANPSFSLDINEALPTLCAVMGPVRKVDPLAQPVEGKGDAATSLALRQPAEMSVSIVQESGGDFLARRKAVASVDPASPCGASPELLSASIVQVPQLGTPYLLPIPKGALFGGTQFEMSLTESGALTGVKYGNTSGTAGLVSAVGTAADTLTDSAADRAARRKSEADMVYQQQRLVKCQMDPTTCPKE